MRLLLYYVTHTFINSIKKLFRTWVIIFIAAMMLLGLLIGFGSAFIADTVMEDEQIEETVEEADEEEEEESLKELLAEMKKTSPEELDEIYRMIGAVVVLIFLGTLLFNIYTAQKGGAEIFTMSDVNFLFTAPLKPQSVLLFKTVLQMGLLLLGSVYIVFQIPNLIINVGMSVQMALGLMALWLVLIVIGKLCSIFVYTLTATKLELRKYIRPFVFTVLIILVAVVSIISRIKYGNIVTTTKVLFGSDITFFVPFAGWGGGIAYAYLCENYMMLTVYSLLMLVGTALCIFGIWHMKADFYEDALTSANKTQEKLEAASSGIMVERKRSEKLKRDAQIGKGEGANAFFFKQMYNRKRFAKFGIFTNSLMLYLGCVVLIYLFCRFTEVTGSITVIGMIILAFVFFKSYISPVAAECELNYIYMIPESPFQKIGYIMLAEVVECFVDVFPVMLISKFLFDTSFLQAILWTFVVVSLDFILAATSLIIESVLPSSLPDMIRAMLLLFLKMVGVLPMLIVIVVFAVMDLMAFAFSISVVINTIVGLVFIFLSSLLLHGGKK